MNHLSEEQMIDILMQEPHEMSWRRHLDGCDNCQERFQILEEGLRMARDSKPAVPLMPVPRISFDKYRRTTVRSRMTWLAAAAMLLLSFSGLSLKVDGNGLNVQFGLPGMDSGAQNTRVADLERELELMNYKFAMFKQEQSNFMALVDERAEESESAFQNAAFVFEGEALNRKVEVMAMVKDSFEKNRKDEAKAKLRGQ